MVIELKSKDIKIKHIMTIKNLIKLVDSYNG